MLFLLQDCSFDSLGISSVAVCLVDMGNAQMFQPYLYRLADQKCAPVLLFCFSPLNSLSNLQYIISSVAYLVDILI